MMTLVIPNLERKETSRIAEIKRVKNHPQEIKFQWQLDNSITIIQVCTTIQPMKTVMKIIARRIRAG